MRARVSARSKRVDAAAAVSYVQPVGSRTERDALCPYFLREALAEVDPRNGPNRAAVRREVDDGKGDKGIAGHLLGRSDLRVGRASGRNGVVTDKGDDEGADEANGVAKEKQVASTNSLDCVEGRESADEGDDAENWVRARESVMLAVCG